MPEEPIDQSLLEKTKEQIRKLVAEIAELAESDIQPSEFHAEFLNRVVAAVAASGGALWLMDGRGSLKLQCQVDFRLSGLLDGRVRTQPHDGLLACMLRTNQPQVVPPGAGVEDVPGAGNPTPFALILAPLVLGNEVIGLVEILMDPNRKAATQRSTLRFVGDLCDLAIKYLKNRQVRQIMSQQQMWGQLEAYSHAIHSSLDLKETAYAVVNDGKRLVGCDRLSVVMKLSGRTAVEAVSGQEVVEQRSNLVRDLTRLCKAVMQSGEDLIYTGETESFSPEVRDALEIYVDESGSKGLAIALLHKPESDATKEKVVFGCLVAEQIGDHGALSDVQARLDVIARHAGTALWNAQDYDRIFLRPMLKTIGSQLRVLRGRTWAKIGVAFGLVILTILMMALVPWTLTVQGDGTLTPENRRTLYAPIEGKVVEVLAEHGQTVKPGDVLLRMENLRLQQEYQQVFADFNSARIQAEQLQKALADSSTRYEERGKLNADLQEANARREGAERQLEVIREQMAQMEIKAPIAGMVTTWEVKKTLLGRPVEIGQELIQIANKDDEIVLEVQVPDNDMAPVLAAKNRMTTEMARRAEALRESLASGIAGDERVMAQLELDIITREQRRMEGGISEDELRRLVSEVAEARKRLKEMGGTIPETRIPAYFVTATDPSHRYQGEVIRVASRAELVEDRHVVKVTVGFTPEVRNEFLALNKDFRPGAEVRAGLKCGKARMAYSLFRDVVQVWYHTVLFRWPFL